jgi:hypothetical protein
MFMTKHVQVGPAPGGFLRYRFPFDQALIDRIKARIPKHARAYRPEAKAWDVRPGYAEVMRDLIYIYFGVVLPPDEHELEEELHHLRDEVAALRAQLQQAVIVPEPCRVLYLLPGAPPEVVRAVHRTLVKLHHPDVGGDLITMQRINDAADQLQRKEAC